MKSKKEINESINLGESEGIERLNEELTDINIQLREINKSLKNLEKILDKHLSDITSIIA